MKKKDYELIAKTIKGFIETEWIWNKTSIGLMLADVLKENNPKFDRQKFLTACGIETRYEAQDSRGGTYFFDTEKEAQAYQDKIKQ